jgi:hypothetical protein
MTGFSLSLRSSDMSGLLSRAWFLVPRSGDYQLVDSGATGSPWPWFSGLDTLRTDRQRWIPTMTDAHERDVTAAYRELLDGLRSIDAGFLEGPRAIGDEREVGDGYRTALTALGVALDTYLFADRSRPLLVDVAGPLRRDRRWGGDNTDSWYSFTPIDPRRTYRISGQRGDSAYFCFTIYNEPSPGEWSNRIVAHVNDTDLDVDADGRFSFAIGPSAPPGHDGLFVAVDEDGAVAFTRDYQVDARHGQRVVWDIEPLDPPEPLEREDDATAAALRAALRFVRTLFDIVPLELAPADPQSTQGHNTPLVVNEFAEPYRVVGASYGWSALDAAYALATFAIEPGQAIVITHRPPACRFWNLVVWNAFMATESLLDARTSINMGAAVPNADGTVTIVVAHDQLAHPNAISTAGRDDGALAFRWFLAESVPARPTVAIVDVADAPGRPS